LLCAVTLPGGTTGSVNIQQTIYFSGPKIEGGGQKLNLFFTFAAQP